MKIFTKTLNQLVFTTLLSTSLVAQTTIIELDGGNSEFDLDDWTITNDLEFSNAEEIVIPTGEEATLSIANIDLYSNINVEVHFTATNLSFNCEMSDGTETIPSPGMQSTISNQTISNFSFNNSEGFAISSINFSDFPASTTPRIVYLHITGTFEESGDPTANTSEVTTQDINSVLVQGSKEKIEVDTNVDGSIEVFSLTGQKVLSGEVKKGKNNFEVMEKGVLLVTVRNRSNAIINRSKLVVNF